jgi:hypothetical protein
MTGPFLPGGQSELPARRFVLFADGDNSIRHIDESVLLRDGGFPDTYWVSPSLNNQIEDLEATLTLVTLMYVATAAGTLLLDVSKDGGLTWEQEKSLAVAETSVVRRVSAGFNLTGYDLRFRIRFPSASLVLVHEYSARLLPRSEHITLEEG